ncbi:MAG: hypothetical protein JNJ57_09015 [Saprospiraceae bacterium]|nr:hypothetical protein [Saprospiraceae bacterium]
MARVTFLKRLITRWTVWEYMPWWVANIPVYSFWLWYALRSRHIFFFSNVNPAIPLGGAVGESKSDILRLLPDPIVPKWMLVLPGQSPEQVRTQLEKTGISFPLIAKPDVGERGFLVKKLSSPEELFAHLDRWQAPFILQEFLIHPFEASVLFHRFPGPEGRFSITSVCLKEFMSVRGDGRSNIRALMAADTRSAFQLKRFEKEFPEVLEAVPAAGETILLEPIGNHARGTKFLNGNGIIDEQMLAAFEPLCSRIHGVQYARFDLKYESLEGLRRGEFKTMELNGVLGEPAHVYDPTHGMWRAYRDLWRHWRLLFELHRAQKKQGFHPTPMSEALKIIKEYFAYKKRLGE